MSKFTFAHLIGRKAKATEEDDEKTRKAKGRRAEDDDEEENAENDDPESEEQDDEEKGRKAKKAKSKKANDDEEDPDAEEDEEAEDDDDNDNKDVKKGRRAEQKRCAQIFGSKAAADRPDMAAHLAFNTSLSASEAISTLKAMGSATAPQSNGRSLDARMREEEQVRLGQDADVAPKGSAASIANKMTSLYNSNKGGK